MDLRERLMASCPQISEETAGAFMKYCGERLSTDTQQRHYAHLLSSVCSYARCDYPYLETPSVREWLSIRRGNLAERTFTGELSALRSLFKVMDEYLGTASYSCLSFVDSVKAPVRIEKGDVPSLSSVNRILEEAKDDPPLYVSVILALRCSLGITDIVSMKTGMFFFDKDGIPGIKPNGRRQGYIRMPDDVVPFVSEYIAGRPKDEWLFPAQKRRGCHVSPRWMQTRLNEVCVKAGIPEKQPVTYRSLRALGILSMLEGGAGYAKVADYVGMKESNLAYYGKAVAELRDSAADYSRIRLVNYDSLKEGKG